MQNQLTLASFLLVLGSSLAAQTTPTYVWSPPNCATLAGGSNNTIPFWSASSTYQQVHDASAMPAGATVLKGLAIRPQTSSKILGRSWDLQLFMGHTKATALNASTTFSSNFTSTPTQVFGSATAPFKTFKWADFTKNGLQVAFDIPFDTNFLYLSAAGNFCWEWRHKNASATNFMAMDAASGQSHKGTTLASLGSGCTPSGGTGATQASLTSVRQGTKYQQDLVFGLSNAPASSPVLLALSLNSTTVDLGWCDKLIVPLFLVGLASDSTGSLSISRSLGLLAGTPQFSIYTQYAYPDKNLNAGIGLSNVAGFTTPTVPGAHALTRIYKATYSSTSNGDELATIGSATWGYGLVVGFRK